jgi:hypothetical protein
MSRILFLTKLVIVFVSVITISGCSTSKISPYKSEITGEKTTDCSELEPDNPYSAGSGHYAGFEWAQKNEPSSCSGNSQSFIEGCEDWQAQQEDYDECISK